MVDERTVLMVVHAQSASVLLAGVVKQLEFASEAAEGNGRPDVAAAFEDLAKRLEIEMTQTLDEVQLLAKPSPAKSVDRPSEGTEP